MSDRVSKALTEARTVLSRAVTARQACEGDNEIDVVPAMLDDDGVYQPGGTVRYRDPQADEIQADLDQVIAIMTKYARGGKVPKSLQERRLDALRRDQG